MENLKNIRKLIDKSIQFLIEQSILDKNLKISLPKPEILSKYNQEKIKQIYKTAKEKILNNQKLTEEEIASLKYMFDVLSQNTKTGIAIDFMPGNPFDFEEGTCGGTCEYCYVIKLMQTKPQMKERYLFVTKFIKNYPQLYFEIVRDRLEALFNKYGKELDAIRWFGSGDYQPFMKDIITGLAKEFPHKKFYIISKTLVTHYPNDIFELLKYPNIYINLSFHLPTKKLIQNYLDLKKKYSNLRIAYTLGEYEGVNIYKVQAGEKVKIDINDYIKSVIDQKKKRLKDELTKRFLVLKELEKRGKITPEEVSNFETPYNMVSEMLSQPIHSIVEFSKIEKLYTGLYKNLYLEIMNKGGDEALELLGFKKEQERKKEREKIKQILVGKIPEEIQKLLEYPKVPSKALIVELTPEYLNLLKNVDVIFNVNRQLAFKAAYYKSQLHFCECDLHTIHEYRACVSTCHQCYSVNVEHINKASETQQLEAGKAYIKTKEDIPLTTESSLADKYSEYIVLVCYPLL